MTRRASTLAIAALATTLSGCERLLASPCGDEQLSCAEQQHAVCAPPGPAARAERLERDLRLELSPLMATRACAQTASQQAYFTLQRYDQGDGRGGPAEFLLEPDEGDCHMTFEVRVEQYDPKQERDVLAGGADARVRLCRASLEISHAASYGDLSPWLTVASIRSGDDMVQLLHAPVELSIVEPGATPTDCDQPLADRELEQVYYAWDLRLSLTILELQRLFGGVERPRLHTTWLLEQER